MSYVVSYEDLLFAGGRLTDYDYELNELHDMVKQPSIITRNLENPRLIHDIVKNRFIFTDKLYLTQQVRDYLMDVFRINPKPNSKDIQKLRDVVGYMNVNMSKKQMLKFFKNKRNYARKKVLS